MRIAHFGTFDVENYGDLLFPLILERRLADICDEFVHVSPVGGAPIWGDCVSSVPFDEVMRDPSNIDSVIVGGGNIIHASPDTIEKYNNERFSSSFAYPGLWLGAGYVAAKNNLTLCWNLPGVPRPFTPITSRLVEWAAQTADYIGVRDIYSKDLLQKANIDGQINVAPDTALEISKLWTSEELSRAYRQAFFQRGKTVPENSIVFHLNPRYVTGSIEKLSALIDRICEKAQATGILIAIGPCHGDDVLQQQVAQKMSSNPLTIDRPQSLREVAACIAHSDAYLGSSLHGMVTACSFGKRGMIIASKTMPKFTGFLEQFHLSQWQSETWEEAEERVTELFSAPESVWKRIPGAAAPILDEHWGRIRSLLQAWDNTPTIIADKRPMIEQLHDIGRSYFGEGEIFKGIVADNLLDLQKQVPELRQQLRRAQNEKEKLEGWMESVNEQVPELLGSGQWRIGRLLYELRRRALRRPRVPTEAAYLVNTLQQYRSWRHGSFATPVRIPESSLEKRAKRLLELAESNGSLPRTLRSTAGRATVAAKRRAHLEYKKLKPRMSPDELAGRIRQRLGPVTEPAEYPSVSIVVLNRNGLSYLEKLFAGLRDKTDYPTDRIELVLVDNASTDGSVEFVKSFEAPFAVRVIRNAENVSFSEGNNQGAEIATGKNILFLNNDIEPFEPGWLEEMVALRRDRGAAAVGARLLYRNVTEHYAPSGYALQHRGVGFRKRDGEEWHRNVGIGEDALDGHLGVDEERPAVTAACMLVERSAFESVGGFTGDYRYGSEDVDLCLKLLSEGQKIVSSGRAVLLHDESPSQKAAGREFMRTNRSSNRRLFWERWGPELRRRCRLDRLGGGGFWSAEGRPHVALTVTSNDPKDGYGDWHTAHEMGDALAERGWRVSYVERKGERWYSLPEDLDYLMVLIDLYDISKVPEGVTTVAWIRNWTERWVSHPWFGEYGVVLASSGISKRIIEESSQKKVDAIFPIATNPERFSPTAPEPLYEADYVFTGNFWGELRGVVDAAEVKEGETFRLFGKGWENVPEAARYAQGPLPYDEMPKVYSSSKLVIDDTASPTLPYGAINSRVFDALATGTLVLTNCETGARELFDEDFPTYSDRESMRRELDRLLADGEKRKALAERYRRLVLENHTYESRVAQLSELLVERERATSFCIKIGAPNRKEAERWGDTHYAKAMKRQLEAAGHPCSIQTLDEWDSFEGVTGDVVIHLKGLTPYDTKPGGLNVLWNISHPEDLTPEECEKYDLVFVASRRWAESLASRVKDDTPIYPLQQATDPEIFYPEYDEEHDRELVFVGNSRRVERRILKDLLPTGRDLAVWGGDWKGLIDERYVVGEYLPNTEVRKAYSSAAIVLNDHWLDMREHGFISNRIYDALACGAFVISDRLEELDEEFGDAVVTYESAEELKELVDYYLDHPEERREKGERGREIVLENHTFEGRIREILAAVSGLSASHSPHSSLPVGGAGSGGRAG